MNRDNARPGPSPRRIGIGGRLLLAFGTVAAFTLIATAVAWVLFGEIRRNLSIIANESMPVTAISFRLAEQSARLGLALPNLAGASSEGEVERIMDEVDETIGALVTETELLNYFGHPDISAEGFIGIGQEVRTTAEQIHRAALDVIESTRQRETVVAELFAEHERFLRAVAPVLGAAREEVIASSRRTVADGANRIGDLIDNSFEALRAVLEVQASVYLITSLMHYAAIEDEVDSVLNTRSAIVAPMATIANAVPQLPASDEVAAFKATAERITGHALGRDSVFEMRVAALIAPEAEAAVARRELSDVLSTLDEYEERFARLGERVIATVDSRILATAATAAREGSEIVRRIHDRIDNLENVLLLRSQVNRLVSLLSEAGHVADTASLDSSRERYETLVEATSSNLERLPTSLDTSIVDTLIDALREIGGGKESIFDIRRDELVNREHAQKLQMESQILSERLNLVALNLVNEAESAAYTASSETRQSIEQGESTLLILAGISFLVALLITWLYVLRILVSRLTGLSKTTLAIAEGQLDTPIEARGNDEVFDMANALTVFRDNARKRQQAEQALRVAKDSAEQMLSELKAAQASLIQSEKMASLGQLTAGIAHEIKNPLNFVNNFSEVSVELLDEMREELAQHLSGMDDDTRAEVEDLIRMLSENLARIKQHGARADSIVKGMLSHAREDSGNRTLTDLNALTEEALNLAYHGARAENSSFNVTIRREFDPAVGEIEVYPQEITRVLLNLIGNAFYAVHERQKGPDAERYEPVVTVSTSDLGGQVSVCVRDNGVGMAEEVRSRIFNPFFTTKPAGEGTGLGLSLSYDIVVKQHGGELEVDSRENEYSEFRMTLPRKSIRINEVTSDK